MNLSKIPGCLVLFVLIFSSQSPFAQTDTIASWADYPNHPRILLFAGEEAAIKKKAIADPAWRTLHEAIIKEADRLLKKKPVTRVMTGRRLLAVSREALRRIFFLSYAWRMTNKEVYGLRTEKEMLAVAAFSDWNPSHFLDVAEMTMAMAIGYDWTYHQLSNPAKQRIAKAIIDKGLLPSLDAQNNYWLRTNNNWNQVCNAGITFGAMAVYENDSLLSLSLINRAITSVPAAMKEYSPDGAYPEGYAYWGYGTSFNVMLISALEKLFNQDFGLNAIPGFLKTAGYLENMTGPTGIPFNYSDAGMGGGLQPAMFWFASRLNNPSLLWVERSRLMQSKEKDIVRNRLLPAALIWQAGLSVLQAPAPDSLTWIGHGATPVALMRSSWTDRAAIFVGMKGGTPSENHAHMDIGSFVMDADGERWAMDFGMQEYESLESKGIKIWGRTQDAERWSVFRYTNQAHNTITVNNQHQRVNGFALITASSSDPTFMYAVTDMTELYKGVLTEARRGIGIVNKAYVVVRDEIKTADTITTVRWNMVTQAAARITGDKEIELTQNGKMLLLKVDTDAPVEMKTWLTDPPHRFDAANPGTVMVGFEIQLPPGTTAAVNVFLVPQKAMEHVNLQIPDLSEWKTR
ncbi:MAG: heparinase II/III family protein [Chitinophagaceae bacterium]|nr:heparinase II/III family protein [Chitinophagaceae bacterium]